MAITITNLNTHDKIKSIFFFLGLSLVLISCGEGGEEAAKALMTTEEVITEAKELGADEFNEKYPMDAEITLEGQVRTPATWKDNVLAKFGTGSNDLPLITDFMFEANGKKDATKQKSKKRRNCTIHWKSEWSILYG